MLDRSRVIHVYSGIDGRCCCGCAGKHTYASRVADQGQKLRGYAISADEVSDRTVAMICNKIARADERDLDIGLAGNDVNYIATVVGRRLYIAYFNKA